MEFRFIVPVRQAEPWVEKCIKSIQAQGVESFKCMIIDDESTDGTFEKALEAVRGDDRFTVQRSGQRRYPLANRIRAIKAIAQDPEDIVVLVDGDDWLRDDRVLERLQEVYQDPDVWLSYGSYQFLKEKLSHRLGLRVKRGTSDKYPEPVHESNCYRYYSFIAGPLRTFRRFLWDGISDDDLRDEDGEYFRSATDFAITIPMLEMAGKEHIRFVEDIMYVYNQGNPGSYHHAQRDLQILCEMKIRAKPRYGLLER